METNRRRFLSAGAAFFVPTRVGSRTETSSVNFNQVLARSVDSGTMSFVDRNGTDFVLDGEPVSLVGTNNFWISYLHEEKSMVDRIMEEVKRLGFNAIRTWGFGSGSDRLYQPSPGEYNEDAFERMDYIVKRATDYGIKLIIPFTDCWSYYGGISQYVEWSESAERKDHFYTDSTCRSLYRSYIEYFLTRENTYTGRQYRNEPAIAIWELVNEPRYRLDPDGVGTTLRDWIDEMAGFVSSIDSNHLVSTGSEGFIIDEESRYDGANHWMNKLGSDFVDVHQSSNVDVASFHLYPDHWQLSKESAVQFIDDRATEATRELNKPVYLGEFGRSVDRSSDNVASLIADRNEEYLRWYRAMSSGDVNGGLVWQLVDDSLVGAGDDFSIYCPKEDSSLDLLKKGGRILRGSTIDPASLDIFSVTANHRWKSVSSPTFHDNPVVFALPMSHRGPQPGTARLRRVTGESFDIKVEEWLYLDGAHRNETIGCVSTDAGISRLSEGTVFEAGVNRTNHRWSSIEFSHAFSKNPVVLTQVQTFNGQQPVVSRNRNVSADGMEVRLQEEERRGFHFSEEIGYLALESGTGAFDGRTFEVDTVDGIDGNWRTISFESAYQNPVFVADLQTSAGTNTCSLRYRNLSQTSVEVLVEEERSADQEVAHLGEQVGYFVIEQDR